MRASFAHCRSEKWLDHPGTVGKPIAGAAIKILGPDMQELLAASTAGPPFWPDVTYIDNDAKRRAIDAGEYFITVGDVGRVDEDGFLLPSA